MMRRPPRSPLDRSSAASDVYKRQVLFVSHNMAAVERICTTAMVLQNGCVLMAGPVQLSLIHISEPTRPY